MFVGRAVNVMITWILFQSNYPRYIFFFEREKEREGKHLSWNTHTHTLLVARNKRHYKWVLELFGTISILDRYQYIWMDRGGREGGYLFEKYLSIFQTNQICIGIEWDQHGKKLLQMNKMKYYLPVCLSVRCMDNRAK